MSAWLQLVGTLAMSPALCTLVVVGMREYVAHQALRRALLLPTEALRIANTPPQPRAGG